MQKLIEKYKSNRKIKFLTKKYTQKYAFIGVGNHSINNLYPVLDYLNINLKYIVSNSEATAKTINENYDGIEGISDINIALNDSEINGVLISANPSSHFELIKQVLAKDKNVFVEKPPCFTSEELEQLIVAEDNSKGRVVVGMQKRYAPLYQIMKENIKGVSHYNYKYKVGFYPEGDAILDLFIHPLDIVNYIFGKAEITSIQKIEKSKGVITYLLHLLHSDNIIGNVELSTDYWWAKAEEAFFINTDRAYLESVNSDELIAIDKPKSLVGIPLEKVIKPVITKSILFERNSFLPVQEHNQLLLSGYYNEIKTFLDICEGKSNDNKSALLSLKNTYELMNKLK
ncbi:MAG: Gfo/Idh/MocA family oxidoreductase [Bacteroidales bacterium]|nr:Gfo/Idh/MocA family oxidoreductase [Bacteroidales bacterium]